MRLNRILLMVSPLLFALGSLPSYPQTPPNILVIIADDLGVDMLTVYEEGNESDIPHTPNIVALADAGILFRNAWSNPFCSPTRATILTGRYGFRTGVTSVVGPAQVGLPPSELTIPELLTGYSHAAFGKWHLGGEETGPCDQGFSQYAGALGVVRNYYNWAKTVCTREDPASAGTTPGVSDYPTTVNVDDAIAWINDPQTTGPWFVWLAFNAPHSPYQAPPGSQCLTDPDQDPDRACYVAMIESIDTEIGRLSGAIDWDNTTVIFLGDNGTPKDVTVGPFNPDHAKGTLYEGGINIPLIIKPAGGEPVIEPVKALVNTTDLFTTILELAEADLPSDRPIDSISLVPILNNSETGSLRDYVFAERIDAEAVLNQRAAELPGYKLIRTGTVIEFYDLLSDPFEIDDLNNAGQLQELQQENFDKLLCELDLLHSSILGVPESDPAAVEKNRYISFIAGNPPGSEIAIRVTLKSLHGYEEFNEEVRYVGPLVDVPDGTFKAAELQCEAHFMDWSEVGLIHVFGTVVVPDSQYEVAAEMAECGCTSGCGFTLTIKTAAWGDVVAPFAGGSSPQPNFADIAAIVDAFRGLPGAPLTVSADLSPGRPDQKIDFHDISAAVDAFGGAPYGLLPGPQDCP